MTRTSLQDCDTSCLRSSQAGFASSVWGTCTFISSPSKSALYGVHMHSVKWNVLGKRGVSECQCVSEQLLLPACSCCLGAWPLVDVWLSLQGCDGQLPWPTELLKPCGVICICTAGFAACQAMWQQRNSRLSWQLNISSHQVTLPGVSFGSSKQRGAPPGPHFDLVGHDGLPVQAGLPVEQDHVAIHQVALHDVPRAQLSSSPHAVPILQVVLLAGLRCSHKVGAWPLASPCRQQACLCSLLALVFSSLQAALVQLTESEYCSCLDSAARTKLAPGRWLAPACTRLVSSTAGCRLVGFTRSGSSSSWEAGAMCQGLSLMQHGAA